MTKNEVEELKHRLEVLGAQEAQEEQEASGAQGERRSDHLESGP